MREITKHPCIACGKIITSTMYVRQLCKGRESCFKRQKKCIGRKVKFYSIGGDAFGRLQEVRQCVGGVEWVVMPDGGDRPKYLCPGAILGCELFFEPTDWKGRPLRKAVTRG